MLKKSAPLLFTLALIITAGCTLIEDLASGLAALCELDTYVVNKTDDTYDALCTADDCSLRDAIATANSCAGPHTIELPAGTYIISRPGRDEDGNVRGDYDITDDLTINGAGNPIVGGSGHDRVFEIHAGVTVEINGLYITGGNAQLGGGLRNHGATTINASQFYDNSATVPAGGLGSSSGGAIFNETDTLTLNNAEIFNNVADEGGAIHNFATATLVTNSLFVHDNIANDNGGALWNNFASTSTHHELTMRDNTAHNIGGGISNGGDLTVAAGWFLMNAATGRGGGLFNSGDANVHHGLFEHNTAAETGAGIENGGTLELSNVTLSGNITALLSGPALLNGGTATLNFVTITGNSGVAPGGAVFTGPATIDINNSIIANNTGGDCSLPAGMAFATANLDSDGTCSGFTLTADPLLGPLADNGGATKTHALLPGSPALDAATGACVSDDQRGVSRPEGAACDLGAFELSDSFAPPSPEAESGETVVTSDTLCWEGPGGQYKVVSSVQQNTPVVLLGVGAIGDWFIIDNPRFPGVPCWLDADDVEIDPGLDLNTLRVFPVPRLPTPTPTPNPLPQAPSNLYVASEGCDQTNYVITLGWNDNSTNEQGFRLYRQGPNDNGPVLLHATGPNTTTYTDQVSDGATYLYFVEAFNEVGVSARIQISVPTTQCLI
jgi:CSLREA domain-containing protein